MAASEQLPELPNDPEVGEALRLIIPVGVFAPLEAVSVTVARHVVAAPSVSEVGEHDTLVEVESTVGAGVVAAIEEDWPLLVLCAPSPW